MSIIYARPQRQVPSIHFLYLIRDLSNGRRGTVIVVTGQLRHALRQNLNNYSTIYSCVPFGTQTSVLPFVGFQPGDPSFGGLFANNYFLDSGFQQTLQLSLKLCRNCRINQRLNTYRVAGRNWQSSDTPQSQDYAKYKKNKILLIYN